MPCAANLACTPTLGHEGLDGKGTIPRRDANSTEHLARCCSAVGHRNYGGKGDMNIVLTGQRTGPEAVRLMPHLT